MNKSGLKNILLGISFLLNITTWAQVWTAGDNVTLQVSEFALIETNHAPVTLTLATSTAGAPVGSVSNSDLFVKISSIVPGGTDRELTAKVSSGTIPAGTSLSLVSANCTTTNSGGTLGTAITTPILLSAIDQFLVRYIATCYTGTGYNDGYKMTFTWAPLNPAANYSQIAAATYNITVVFTLTAHDGN
ncbi:MAG: hypothetical protein CVT99_15575 [Bacteroidetes bacterium HGW-Bacteroidetes-16]|jgi:hypothetical protein|nr:MAG: hypothetical protein CVT99_15575 [Bacteroidetes bacterium HGW-Bacteroidetes-16]